MSSNVMKYLIILVTAYVGLENAAQQHISYLAPRLEKETPLATTTITNVIISNYDSTLVMIDNDKKTFIVSGPFFFKKRLNDEIQNISFMTKNTLLISTENNNYICDIHTQKMNSIAKTDYIPTSDPVVTVQIDSESSLHENVILVTTMESLKTIPVPKLSHQQSVKALYNNGMLAIITKSQKQSDLHLYDMHNEQKSTFSLSHDLFDGYTLNKNSIAFYNKHTVMIYSIYGTSHTIKENLTIQKTLLNNNYPLLLVLTNNQPKLYNISAPTFDPIALPSFQNKKIITANFNNDGTYLIIASPNNAAIYYATQNSISKTSELDITPTLLNNERIKAVAGNKDGIAIVTNKRALIYALSQKPSATLAAARIATQQQKTITEESKPNKSVQSERLSPLNAQKKYFAQQIIKKRLSGIVTSPEIPQIVQASQPIAPPVAIQLERPSPTRPQESAWSLSSIGNTIWSAITAPFKWVNENIISWIWRRL